ncbi:uncharacterized protein LOC100937417 [Pongo abelii]|uniref:uncharacterized protein LOC100937417 n=1 Tax=Pongo abelii TaxID=9601 RepID=UPI000CEF70E1|nr:uncharacterized protein LOC100937417 [Pongo abelii]
MSLLRDRKFLGVLAPKQKLAKQRLLLNKAKCKTEHWNAKRSGFAKCGGWEWAEDTAPSHFLALVKLYDPRGPDTSLPSHHPSAPPCSLLLRIQRREECGLHFTCLPSLALDLKFHTTEPNTSRSSPKDIRNRKLCLAADKLSQCPWDLQDVWNEERFKHVLLFPKWKFRKTPHLKKNEPGKCGTSCLGPHLLATSGQLSQDGKLSGGPQKNVLCGRRLFPIRQTVLQPRPPKRNNPGLLFSGTECSCILPFLCFLSQYLLMVHAQGLGKLGV